MDSGCACAPRSSASPDRVSRAARAFPGGGRQSPLRPRPEARARRARQGVRRGVSVASPVVDPSDGGRTLDTFFEVVLAKDTDSLDGALEGLMFALSLERNCEAQATTSFPHRSHGGRRVFPAALTWAIPGQRSCASPAHARPLSEARSFFRHLRRDHRRHHSRVRHPVPAQLGAEDGLAQGGVRRHHPRLVHRPEGLPSLVPDPHAPRSGGDAEPGARAVDRPREDHAGWPRGAGAAARRAERIGLRVSDNEITDQITKDGSA